MQILVTGGGGYLGCHLVPTLLERGHDVRLLDRFCFGEEAIESFRSNAGCEVFQGDVRRLQEFPDLLDGVDCIVHLAGLANDPSCELNPDMTLDVNVESTRELASRAVQSGIRRFILASTCSVYGHGVFDFLDEESPPEPVSTYGRTTYAAEQAVLSMAGAHFEPVIARLSTLFGWSPRMRFDLAVNLMVALASRQRVINILGGGNQWRPFLHVRDGARALGDLVEAASGDVAAEVLNVGTDDGNLSILNLAQRVREHISGAELSIARDDEDQRNYRVNFGKIRERIGFESTCTIDEGIEEVRLGLEDASIDPFADQYINVERVKCLLATPVEEGGEPAAPRFIPLSRPTLGVEEEEAVLDALRSGWLTSGPQLAAFESGFKERVAAKYAIAVTSCTAAIQLCLVHLGIKPGDEIITTPLTWPSVGNAMVHMGAKIVFADVSRDTLNIDPASVERAITDKTRAILPVHMAGEPCDLEAIYALGAKHGIPIVEDAAHALGARYKGTLIGSYGEFACFSFYAIKNLTTMEGGMITVADEAAAEHLRMLASHGIASTAWDRYGRSGVAAPPEVVEPGYKMLMGNVSAAIGVEQLKKLDGFQAVRRRLANLYRSALAEMDEIELPKIRNEEEHAWHLMVIRLRLEKLVKTRNEIAHALRQENVGTGFHFYGLHLHEYYKTALAIRPEDLPEATAASNDVLSLPLYPGMRDRDVHVVAAALKKVLGHARK